MKKYFHYLLTVLLCWIITGCQEDQELPRTKQLEIDTVITIKPPVVDTVLMDTIAPTSVKREVRKTITKKVVKKVIRPAEEIDVDAIPPDPFEDPDYIGTPCGDYVDGKCTRHAQCRKK